MGWKAFAIFAAEEPGYFGTQPVHAPERAEQVRRQLGLPDYDAAGSSCFDTAMYPANGSLFIGAYPRGVIVCESDLPILLFTPPSRPIIGGVSPDSLGFTDRVLNLYPQGEVLAIVLHSVVDLWGYSFYSRGQLQRCAAGSADSGVIENLGNPLPEEARILAIHPLEQIPAQGLGEGLVFEVTARFLGRRIDAGDEITLQMSEYKRKSRGVWGFVQRLLRNKHLLQ